MSFANGVTISVQFGKGNYCDNRNAVNGFVSDETACMNAEIAAWLTLQPDYNINVTELTNGKIVTQSDMDCIGYLDSDDVAKFIYQASIAK